MYTAARGGLSMQPREGLLSVMWSPGGTQLLSPSHAQLQVPRVLEFPLCLWSKSYHLQCFHGNKTINNSSPKLPLALNLFYFPLPGTLGQAGQGWGCSAPHLVMPTEAPTTPEAATQVPPNSAAPTPQNTAQSLELPARLPLLSTGDL